MARKKATPYLGERTEDIWDAETAFILRESLVATTETLRRRRRIIEKTGQTPWPLHMMGNAVFVVWDADEDEKPDRWNPVGPSGSRRPLAWLDRRCWWEWHWFRGIDPTANREPIPFAVKAAVIVRDWPHCQICGGLVAFGEHHLDHVIPYSKGGPDTVDNLRLAHDLCNRRRGARV